jgi:hypothetical protein
MLITELGIVTLVNPEQPLNALIPIPNTELGIDTLVTAVQFENALLPIDVIVRLAALAIPLILRNGAICAMLAPAEAPVILPLLTVNSTV